MLGRLRLRLLLVVGWLPLVLAAHFCRIDGFVMAGVDKVRPGALRRHCREARLITPRRLCVQAAHRRELDDDPW
jgi:hypothetical protein